MERKRINSSKIRAVGYDPKSQGLEIEFSDGRLIQYRGVSPEGHRQFMAAPSATSFFEDKIDESSPSSRIRRVAPTYNAHFPDEPHGSRTQQAKRLHATGPR